MATELETLDFSSNKGHIVQADGDVEIHAAPGQAGVTSHGGTGLGMSYDDKGYSVASAGPGEGFAFSKRYPESSNTQPPALGGIEGGGGAGGFDPASAAVGAVGGAGAATAGAAACCACCVIL